MTSYTGETRNGRIVLDDGVILPEGTIVRIELLPLDDGQHDAMESRTTPEPKTQSSDE